MTEENLENTKIINANFAFCFDMLNNGFKDVKIAPSVDQKLEEENTKLKKIIELFCKNDFSQKLHVAVEGGDMDSIKLLLELGADPYFAGGNGETALFAALKFEKYEIAEFLIQNGVDVNRPITNGGGKIVFRLIENNYTKQLEFLLRHGLDLNVCADNEYGTVPIGYAVGTRKMDIVKLFIEHGADVNKCDKKGKSPLLLSVGNADIFKLLIEHNADINKCDKNGCSPLLEATYYERVDIVKILVEKGANLNSTYEFGYVDRNALEWAVWRRNQKLTKLFLKKGMSLDKTHVVSSDLQWFKKIKKQFDEKQKKKMKKAAPDVSTSAFCTTSGEQTVKTQADVPTDYIKTVLSIGEKTYPYEGSIKSIPDFIEQMRKF